MANRLATATSPYLRQHADNPVDWWPWCTEAFDQARERDVPVLLSVGYAACHWCHVMAHESFEDPATAELVNAHCVPIKVDREERPDIDSVYMAATQLVTGRGGWPMTVWCTPGGEPFYCGTYFPREHFSQLVVAAAQAWREQREAVLSQGESLRQALERESARNSSLDSQLTPADLATAAQNLAAEHDQVNGGFGGAPKFPPSMVGQFLLRYHTHTGDSSSLEMVRRTCEAMARGGMYDQLGGGFARYSVDETWTVPHFEKMLYDNALLLGLYLNLWQITGSKLARRVADQTADFLLAELRTSEGGFASSLDADTDGVEGATYAWTPQQLRDLLGPADGEWVANLCQVTAEGSFEHGTSVLQLRRDPDDEQRWARLRAMLSTARAQRPQPARDDKVITAWNGLTIAALAEHGVLTENPTTLDAAIGAAELVLAKHWRAGVLARTSLAGVVGPPGVLEDYGCLAEALCVLHQATGQGRWLSAAGEILDAALAHFGDPRGGFFDTSNEAEPLFQHPKELPDTATPSGTSAMISALINYSALSGKPSYQNHAVAALSGYRDLITRAPRFTGWGAAAALALLSGPLQIAIVGSGPLAEQLRATAWRAKVGGAVVAAGEPDAQGVPMLANRPLVDGSPAAYVCRRFVCDLPITDPAALKARLAERFAPANAFPHLLSE
ncbi:MAG: hypothetical protein DLM55_12450 [Acidimicrobiales bacterium]|nr:MAG: hypothetical protein DLM55_12450 [Acidimicrobiales bacterium]